MSRQPGTTSPPELKSSDRSGIASGMIRHPVTIPKYLYTNDASGRSRNAGRKCLRDSSSGEDNALANSLRKEASTKFKVLSDKLAEGCKVDISSPLYNHSDLVKAGISFRFVEENPLEDLQAHGFFEFPFDKTSGPILLSESMLPEHDDLEQFKANLDEECKKSHIEIEWCTPEEAKKHYTRGQRSATRNFFEDSLPNPYSEDSVNDSPSHLFNRLGFAKLTNNHPLQYTFWDGPELIPDIMLSPFELENGAVRPVFNIPALVDTCQFLTKIVQIHKARIGNENLVLPVMVGEYKKLQQPDKREDIAKLIKEMKVVRDMLELVWLNPPNINYGLYVWHTEWRVFAMRKGSLVARQIFREVVENSATKINTARFLFVLTNHMKEQLSTVQLVSTERQEEILEQFRMRATISSTIAKPTTTAKSTTTTKTSKKTKPKSTSTTRTADKSAPEKDQSKSSKPSKEKSASKDKKSENKENRNPNKGKSFNQNKLALSRLHENIFTATLGNQPVIFKLGSSRKIRHEVNCYGQFFAKLLEFGTIRKRSCIVLPLYSRLPMPANSTTQVLSISRQVLHALSTMHKAGYIHGDVKYSNIMWEESNSEVKLIDFETATEVAMTDRVDGYFGTTTYMAPEVTKERWVSHKSDVFSAGLVIASLIYSIRITDDKDREKLISLVAAKTPSVLADAHTISIVSKMLNEHPEQRINASTAVNALTVGPKSRVQPAPVKLSKQPVVQAPKRTPLGTITNRVRADSKIPLATKNPVQKSNAVSQGFENVVAIGSRQSGLVIRK